MEIRMKKPGKKSEPILYKSEPGAITENTAPYSKTGREAMSFTVNRAGSNLTNDSAPAAAGEKPGKFRKV
jgi:hypothetical protein